MNGSHETLAARRKRFSPRGCRRERIMIIYVFKESSGGSLDEKRLELREYTGPSQDLVSKRPRASFAAVVILSFFVHVALRSRRGAFSNADFLHEARRLLARARSL